MRFAQRVPLAGALALSVVGCNEGPSREAPADANDSDARTALDADANADLIEADACQSDGATLAGSDTGDADTSASLDLRDTLKQFCLARSECTDRSGLSDEERNALCEDVADRYEADFRTYETPSCLAALAEVFDCAARLGECREIVRGDYSYNAFSFSACDDVSDRSDASCYGDYDYDYDE